METKLPHVAIPHNEPRDLQSRLYREIGISAVTAALQSATYPVESAVRPRVLGRANTLARTVKAA